MPRLFLILAVLLGLATLAGCATGEPVSSAREAANVKPLAAASTETPAPEPAGAAAPAAAQVAKAAVPAAPKAAAQAAANPAAKPATVTPAGGADLTAVTDPKLGKLVTDKNGMTVYFLTTDSTKPPTSKCVDDCATLWPPVSLPASGTVTLNGVDAKLVGKLTRPDRTIQLTLAGHPLYLFSGDAKPGDTLGNGLTGTAFAISPTGTKPAGRA